MFYHLRSLPLLTDCSPLQHLFVAPYCKNILSFAVKHTDDHIPKKLTLEDKSITFLRNNNQTIF